MFAKLKVWTVVCICNLLTYVKKKHEMCLYSTSHFNARVPLFIQTSVEKVGQCPPTSQSERRIAKEAEPLGWGPGRNIRFQAAELTFTTLSSVTCPTRRYGWQKRQNYRSDEAVEGESKLSGLWISTFEPVFGALYCLAWDIWVRGHVRFKNANLHP